MRVKIGNIIFDSEKQPILLIFSQHEKSLISNMKEDDMKFCSFNGDCNNEDIIEFIEGVD